MLNLESCRIPAADCVPVDDATSPSPLAPALDEQTKILAEIATMLYAIQDRLTGCQEKRNVTPPPSAGLLAAVRENRTGMIAILQAVHTLSELIG